MRRLTRLGVCGLTMVAVVAAVSAALALIDTEEYSRMNAAQARGMAELVSRIAGIDEHHSAAGGASLP